MAYILQIDTSGNVGCVALAADGELIAQRINNATRDHAAVIHKMIEDVLEERELQLKDLAAVAVCAGPGSYTGLRIGLSIAKGICYACEVPLMLHNKISMLANQEIKNRGNEYDIYAVALKAREQEAFVGIFDNKMAEILPPIHLRHNICEENIINQKGNLLVITDIEDFNNIKLNSYNINIKQVESIDLNCWSQLSFKGFLNMKFTDLASAEPFYLKEVFISK